MPFSSGTFTLVSGNPVVTGTTISSTWANNTLSDIATGLSTALLKDGTQTPTANIPLGAFKITGLGAGTALTDAAQLSQVQSAAASSLGSVAGTNTITATASPTPSAYASGQVFYFTPANTNTSATSINISSLGAKNVYCNNAACTGGEIVASVPVLIRYDGTQFQIVGTGALVTLATAQELTNKTLTSSVGKGTWTASGTWTLPAFTLGGTVSGGGNQINNVIIGASTPLAANFTTVGASGTVTIGSGSTTSQGWAIGYLGSSGNSGLWTTAVTASTSNYSLAASSTSTVVNAATTLNLSIADSDIVAVSSAGAAVTGTFSASGAAQASTTLAVGGSGLNNSAFAVNGTGKTNFATFSDFTTTTLTIAGSSGVVTLTPTTTLAIASGKDLQLGRAYSAGVVAATGTIAIKDSTGTTYNVLVHN